MRISFFALILVLAAAAQQALASRVTVFGARPDFLLVTLTVLSMRVGTDAAAALGFFAGVLHGGIANAKMSAFVVSRVLGGVAASAVGRTSVVATPITVVGAALATTGVASFVYMLLAVPKDLLGWALSTMGTVVYNTILVLIAHAVLARRRRD
jgi:hypothetical protein